jgi:hypothetical protein
MVLQRLGRLSEAASRRIAEAALARGGAHLVGRERHLAALHEAFRASRRGRTVSISVHGTSGIGKTALIRGFLDELRQQERVVVLEGRCYERESVPYKALDSLVDALSQFLRGLPEARVRSILPGEAGALARLFPVFARVEAVAESGRGFLQIPDSQELRQRAFTALREILAGLGEEDPLVLFIDDLQWGDADSAALLSELLRPPDPPSLLLIASYRSEDAASSPLLRRLAALRTSAGHAEARELVVGELSPRDALRLALARLGPGCREADAEAIARESGGSPFFIDELVRHSQEGAEISPGGNAKAPETRLDEVIRARVRRLPEEARRLLEVVSVAGQPLELPVAKRAAYLRTDEPAVPALRAGHLIRSVGTEEREEIEPYHDRIRQAVVSSLSPDTLRDHHARLAVALEPSPRGDPETLALHFKESGNLERAATYAAEAADRAAEALAFDRAARLYRLALELGVTGRRLSIPLAKALANSGRGAEAAQAYLEATQGANPAQVLDLQRHAAEQFLISGRIDEGLKVLRVVLSSMGLKLAETPRLALLSLLLRRARILLRGLSFRERDAAKVPADDLIRIDACWSGAVGLGLVDPIRGNDFQGRHLLLALDAGEPYRVARALAMEAGYSSASGGRRSVRTERLLQMAVSLSERIQNPHATGLATLTAGIAAFLEGRWQAARHLTDRAEKILREECTGVSWERDNAHHYGLRSLFYLGEWAAMFRRLPGLLKEARERGDLYAETNLSLRHLYVARMAADQIETAREELARSIESWSHGGFHVQHYYAWCARVEMALYSDAGQSAWELVARQWASLRRSLLDRVQFLLIESRHLRARAALAAAAGSRRLLGIAERDCRRIEHEQMPWGNALALLLRAGVSVGRGRTEEALALAASAEEQLTSTDMTVHAAAARRRRGELLGGEKGRDLMAQADAILVAQGIARPQAITAMLAPGPWRAGDGGEFRN